VSKFWIDTGGRSNIISNWPNIGEKILKISVSVSKKIYRSVSTRIFFGVICDTVCSGMGVGNGGKKRPCPPPLLDFRTWYRYIACLHDQNKSGFFGEPAFIQPIRTIWRVFKKLWLAGKKPALQKCHFYFDHVNRLIVDRGLIVLFSGLFLLFFDIFSVAPRKRLNSAIFRSFFAILRSFFHWPPPGDFSADALVQRVSITSTFPSSFSVLAIALFIYYTSVRTGKTIYLLNKRIL